MNATKALAAYINEKGISIKAISDGTGLSEGILYPSLGKGRGRELRADEYLKVCVFLELDPLRFLQMKKAG